jgi:hypothetical protein
LTLFAYDSLSKSLKLITNAGDDEMILATDIPLGEGICGTTFKRRRMTFYINPELPDEKQDGAYLYDKRDYSPGNPSPTQPSVLIGFPLSYPVANESFDSKRQALTPYTAVGVFGVATTALDSEIVSQHEFYSPSKEQTGLCNELWVVGNQILKWVIKSQRAWGIEGGI